MTRACSSSPASSAGVMPRMKPLSLSASIAFEQSYDGVDGDSASSTELCALLSSLAELPIKRGIAVTGSVNQQEQIQAIGQRPPRSRFFDICRSIPRPDRGAGVIIPAANVPTLMLRDDGGSRGRGTVPCLAGAHGGRGRCAADRGGGPARDAEGAYPPDSVNGRVDRKLHELADKLQRFGQPPRRSARKADLPTARPLPAVHRRTRINKRMARASRSRRVSRTCPASSPNRSSRPHIGVK